jgi:hypothetical protein
LNFGVFNVGTRRLPGHIYTQDQYKRNKKPTLTEVREENIMRQNAKFFALSQLVAMGALRQRT